VEHVDLYYLHAPDAAVPFAESLAAVDELVRAGRVARLGLSNFAAWQILEIDSLAVAGGAARPAIAQQLYNLLIRQLDVEYLKYAARHPIHTTVYNPLAGGLLARQAKRGDAPPAGSRFEKNPIYRRRYFTDRMLDLVEACRALAAEAGMNLVELAYAWLAERPGVDSILVGPGSVAHLDAALDGCARTLSSEVRARADALHRDFLGTDASYAR
jgi:aryl-alcohol dehydrogenase-like predicted oxidoreductase